MLCASMPPTIAGSKKKSLSVQWEGEFGCFVIFYVCSVTLGGSSAPLCGSYLLYSHYLFCVVVLVVWGGRGAIVVFVFSARW